MGIVIEELSQFQLSDGSDWRIELNVNETIHIHIDNIQIKLTTEEFLDFIDTIQEAENKLEERKEDSGEK